MKLLVAEDDLTSRRILEAILPKWGYDVLAVANGAEALSALTAAEAPKLAVLDWMMPGLDGVEVCRRVREQPTAEPPYIIMLTALERKTDIVHGLQAGANDYITKPYDTNELQARLGVGRRVVELQGTLAHRVAELQDALAHIKTLQGILPICMHCHRIRSDQESWQRVESYISEHSDAKFSHGICPECVVKYYPAHARQPA